MQTAYAVDPLSTLKRRDPPEPRHASTHTVTVRVKTGQGGVNVIGFDLVVTAA